MRSIPRLLMTVAFVLVLTSSVVHAVYPSATWAERTHTAVGLNVNKLAEFRPDTGNLAGTVVGDGYLVYFWGGP
jgi:hypothetical protein